ncbi:MAG: hypothetical protein WC614_06215 [bacterium]
MENKYITTKVLKTRKHEEKTVFDELSSKIINLNMFFVTFRISLFFRGNMFFVVRII